MGVPMPVLPVRARGVGVSPRSLLALLLTLAMEVVEATSVA
jgi:hypothetical protein